MKYLKTLNLWDIETQEKLFSGELKLQCGQWFKCGKNDNSISRFISCKNGIVNAVHYVKNGKGNNKQFIKRVQLTRQQASV